MTNPFKPDGKGYWTPRDKTLAEQWVQDRLKQPWVLITGSSRGLGRELALQFALNRYNIILHGRDTAVLNELKQEIIDGHPGASLVEVIDGCIREALTIERLRLIAAEKKLTVLVNNAGQYNRWPLDEVTDHLLREIIETNLIAPIRLTQALYPIMKDRVNGTMIVNINSQAAKSPAKGETIYAASKAGLRGFSSALKLEATKDKIYVLDIFLGAMRTKMRPVENEFHINPSDAASVIMKLVQGRTHSVRINELDLLRAQYE